MAPNPIYSSANMEKSLYYWSSRVVWIDYETVSREGLTKQTYWGPSLCFDTTGQGPAPVGQVIDY
jgi:hypothetical protein